MRVYNSLHGWLSRLYAHPFNRERPATALLRLVRWHALRLSERPRDLFFWGTRTIRCYPDLPSFPSFADRANPSKHFGARLRRHFARHGARSCGLYSANRARISCRCLICRSSSPRNTATNQAGARCPPLIQ